MFNWIKKIWKKFIVGDFGFDAIIKYNERLIKLNSKTRGISNLTKELTNPNIIYNHTQVLSIEKELNNLLNNSIPEIANLLDNLKPIIKNASSKEELSSWKEVEKNLLKSLLGLKETKKEFDKRIEEIKELSRQVNN